LYWLKHKPLWFLSNLPLLVCSSLFFYWTLLWCSFHWWWKPPKTCSWLLCIYLHHLERCLLFHSAHYYRFNLRPKLSLLCFLILSVQSCHLVWTSTVVSSACVTVFVFRITFPSPAVFITYSRNSITDQEIGCSLVLHLFWIENHSVVSQSTCPWLLTLHVGHILTLSNAWLFPHFLYCSNLNAAHNKNPIWNL